MTTQVTRRKLLIGAGAVAALPTGWLGLHVTSSRPSIVVGYLREQLPGLAVSDTDLEEFSFNYLDRHVEGAGRNVYHQAIFVMLDSSAIATVVPEIVRSAFEKFSRHLLTGFLLSTDFFGAAKQKPANTTYIGFYDPYASACSNSLANFTLEA